MEKQKGFLVPILKDSFYLTWTHKAWWIVGFFALFLTGSLGYQLIFQGITSLVQPAQWWNRWQTWAQGISPIEFVGGQFSILVSDPRGWFSAVFVWTAVLLVVLVLFSISVYAITTLVSAVKLKVLQGEENIALALKEAKYHFSGVFWTIILMQVVANALILLFSIPVIWFGVNDGGIGSQILLFGSFAIFLVVTFIISMVTFYTIEYIVVQEQKLSESLISAWDLFKKHWVITLEMFFIQILIGVLVTAAVLILISLIAIPVTIVGFILISNNFFDITIYLPRLVLYLLTIISIIAGASISAFQMYSWTFLFMRFKEVHPKSRFAQWIELQFLVK